MWGSALFIVYAWAASGWKGGGLALATMAALLVWIYAILGDGR